MNRRFYSASHRGDFVVKVVLVICATGVKRRQRVTALQQRLQYIPEKIVATVNEFHAGPGVCRLN